jgi:hypothetical protein
MRKELAMRTRTFSAILLFLLCFVLLIGGGALVVCGFGVAFWSQAPQALQFLQGFPGIAIAVVGIILVLAGMGVAMYMAMEYPELKSSGRRN